MATDTAVAAQTEEAAAVAKSKGGSRRLVILGIVATVVIAGYFGYRKLNANRQTTDDAQVEADVVPLAMRVSGQVLAVKVKTNDRVKKGDVLLELDPADLQARFKQAEGELAAAKAQAAAADATAKVAESGARGALSSARAQVTTTIAQVSSADAQIANAKAQVVRAESDAKKALNDLERTKQLRAANAVPQDRLENAQSTVDSTQAAVSAAQAQLAAAEDAKRVAQSRVVEAGGMLDTNTPVDAKIAAAHANAELAKARVTTAEAALDIARLNLSYTALRAPVDGIVTNLNVREGQLLGASQPVAQLVPADVYVVANFKETQVGEMKPGAKVDIKVDAFENLALTGTVESISGGTGSRFSMLPPDNASGNFVKVVQRIPVRIRFSEVPSSPLRAGMSAVVTVHTGE